LAQAREQQKPIFLSIGYSACHWCHVMEHESFENAAIAAVLNEKFVSIKVDREERPDLDQIYMNAVQMMTGRGGWPMTVFLTPDLKPFYAGTYFPPTARGGMPGFIDVLRAVDDAWQNRRDQLGEMAERLTAELQRLDQASPGALEEGCVGRAVAQLRRSFDPRFGGFGPAPKFPHAMDLQLLLRHWRRSGDAEALQMALFTLDRMAAGGIYDHLGGGFARYSVDAQWLVPHFEKMLYDNALLAAAYLDAYLAVGRPQDARCVRETLDYVLRDMTDAQGGFHSAEDADSEGEEGKFYVWTPAELRDVLGAEDAALFAVVYDVTDAGNFEGRNILHLPRPFAEAAAALQQDPEQLRERLDACRAKLLAARGQRVRPGKDDKVLVSWNGLMIAALARAGAALEEPRYVAAAERAADFLWKTLRRPDGRLLHTWRQGVAKFDAYLDDYAGLAWGLFALFEAASDPRRLAQAAELVDQALTLFAAPDGGFYFTAHDHEQLIARNRDLMDNAVPSGNSLLAGLLVRLHLLTGRPHYGEAAGQTLAVAADLLDRAPSAMGQMLMAADLHLGPAYEWVLVGYGDDPETQRALRALRAAFLPHQLVVWADPAAPPAPDALLASLLAGKTAERGQPVLYPCEGFACSAPIVGADAIAAHVRPSHAASE
jgi:uncharacterized protein YyaL (SSP411 family)